ncbi:diguanylate cyclase/phosphodiesterase [Pseudomonas chlororaphis]|uniref:Diguanylate cyclase/phosphodiesterase n=1 Tax=Pseudomonas chlororaphis TaxID=587753 RepID=A0A3G7TJH9_9PSED|nr:diguanylate cyclase/phosphodiesterase [Pseudomonas chlororaphis]
MRAGGESRPRRLRYRILSFDYLKTYKVNHLKISQAFIDNVICDPATAITQRAIINLHVGLS